tara:strand:- start:1491 stop:2327 length:837 start_codon:yes stop_codon:yes gene_type:complete
MKSLKELYQNHSGKVSDKWSIYLNEYEDKLKKYQKLPINFFEIGVLNGGSLEIFSKYFSNAELILGCDIDAKCEKLKFSKPNIKCIIGDVNNGEIKNKIIKNPKFDIILDDGSHNSDDIVKTFCNYFNYLKEDGLYIIEDMHCSYWREHKGGLFFPISSVNFFKKLVDIVNYEHWGVEKNKKWLLRGFIENYKINIDDVELEQIHSIEFVNSLCFIKKRTSKQNKLGKRVVVGEEAIVVSDRKKLNNTSSEALNQNVNQWSNTKFLPEEELEILKNKK